MDTIGDRIKFVRNKLGLNQADFASKVGLSGRASTISDYETNKKVPELAIKRNIAELGETTITWLEEGGDELIHIMKIIKKAQPLLSKHGEVNPDSRELFNAIERFKKFILKDEPEYKKFIYNGEGSKEKIAPTVDKDYKYPTESKKPEPLVAAEPSPLHLEPGAERVNEELIKIPVAGAVIAGVPDYAETYGEYLIARKVKVSDSEAFALRIKGDSMIPEFKEGDYIIVCPNLQVVTGDYAVIQDDSDKYAVKKVMFKQDIVILLSENPAYEPLVYTKQNAPIIIGKVKQKITQF